MFLTERYASSHKTASERGTINSEFILVRTSFIQPISFAIHFQFIVVICKQNILTQLSKFKQRIHFQSESGHNQPSGGYSFWLIESSE